MRSLFIILICTLLASCSEDIKVNLSHIVDSPNQNRPNPIGDVGGDGNGDGSTTNSTPSSTSSRIVIAKKNQSLGKLELNKLLPGGVLEPFAVLDETDGQFRNLINSSESRETYGNFPEDDIYFSITNRISGTEILYKTDGTQLGTVKVAEYASSDLANGIEDGANFYQNGFFFFRARFPGDVSHFNIDHDYFVTNGSDVVPQKILTHLNHPSFPAPAHHVLHAFPLTEGSKILLVVVKNDSYDPGVYFYTEMSLLIVDVSTKDITTVTVDPVSLFHLAYEWWSVTSENKTFAKSSGYLYLATESKGIYVLNISTASMYVLLPGIYRPMVYGSGSRIYIATVNKPITFDSALWVIDAAGGAPLEIYTHSGQWDLYYDYNPIGEDGEILMVNGYDDRLFALYSNGTSMSTLTATTTPELGVTVRSSRASKIGSKYYIGSDSSAVPIHSLFFDGSSMSFVDESVLNNKVKSLVATVGTQVGMDLSANELSPAILIGGKIVLFGEDFPFLIETDGTANQTVLLTDFSAATTPEQMWEVVFKAFYEMYAFTEQHINGGYLIPHDN